VPFFTLLGAGTIAGYNIARGEVTFFLKELDGAEKFTCRLIGTRSGVAGHPGHPGLRALPSCVRQHRSR